MARARGNGSVTAAATWAAGLLRRAMGLAVAMALFALVGESRAHLWHEAAEDLDPATIESLVSALEQAVEDLDQTEWTAPEAGVDSSDLLAFELMLATGRLAELPAQTRRVLVTYDALRFDVVDEQGEFAPDASMAIWLELVRPADAPSIAPFMERLDAWRTESLEAER